jgi:fumarate hydratase class II
VPDDRHPNRTRHHGRDGLARRRPLGGADPTSRRELPVSGKPLPPAFVHALGTVKLAAAKVNRDLGLLDPEIAAAIETAAAAVAAGQYDDHFPIDVFQTGSGTSSNMNANEVIGHACARDLERRSTRMTTSTSANPRMT